jgi:hypothetical protein
VLLLLQLHPSFTNILYQLLIKSALGSLLLHITFKHHWTLLANPLFYDHKQHCVFCTWDAIFLIVIRMPFVADMLQIKVANKNLTRFLAVFKLFHVCVITILKIHYIYNSPVLSSFIFSD